MSSFTGVSVITGGKNCTTTTVDAGTDSGYHLLVFKDYSRTVQEVPNGVGIHVGPLMVGGRRWYIWYCPNGDEPSGADFISFDPYLQDILLGEIVEAKIEFSFVDQDEKQKPKEIFAAATYSFSHRNPSCGPVNFIKRDALERSAYLKADCFTIRCDIMLCKDLNTHDAGGTTSDMSQHFDYLRQNKVGADVTFEVSGETFAAHRCVLAARSKVFMAQLFGPMKEGTTSNAIQIKDMGAKVFEALLKFIYTDSFPEMDKDNCMEEEAVEYVMWLQDLFVAAERYDVQRLKLLCEENLTEHIGVSSVASTLALAEQHHCHILRETCLKFIQFQSPKCLGKVMATDGWKQITRTYPSVLNELIAKLASNQKDDKNR